MTVISIGGLWLPRDEFYLEDSMESWVSGLNQHTANVPTGVTVPAFESQTLRQNPNWYCRPCEAFTSDNDAMIEVGSEFPAGGHLRKPIRKSKLKYILVLWSSRRNNDKR